MQLTMFSVPLALWFQDWTFCCACQSLLALGFVVCWLRVLFQSQPFVFAAFWLLAVTAVS